MPIEIGGEIHYIQLRSLNDLHYKLNVITFNYVPQTFIFYLLLLQLVLCRVAALKISPYIIHSADYIFIYRSFEISQDIQSVQNSHV